MWLVCGSGCVVIVGLVVILFSFGMRLCSWSASTIGFIIVFVFWCMFIRLFGFCFFLILFRFWR